MFNILFIINLNIENKVYDTNFVNDSVWERLIIIVWSYYE